jgi:hypothetical protein
MAVNTKGKQCDPIATIPMGGECFEGIKRFQRREKKRREGGRKRRERERERERGNKMEESKVALSLIHKKPNLIEAKVQKIWSFFTSSKYC